MSDAESGSASAQAAPKASPCKGRATQRRAQPLPTGRSPGRAGSPLGWGPAQRRPARSKARQAARASQGPKPRERAASPHRAKSGLGRRPTRVGSGPVPACAAESAAGSEGDARRGPCKKGRAQPPPTGQSPCRAGSPLGRVPAQSRPSLPGRSRATQGRAPPLPTGLDSAVCSPARSLPDRLDPAVTPAGPSPPIHTRPLLATRPVSATRAGPPSLGSYANRWRPGRRRVQTKEQLSCQGSCMLLRCSRSPGSWIVHAISAWCPRKSSSKPWIPSQRSRSLNVGHPSM